MADCDGTMAGRKIITNYLTDSRAGLELVVSRGRGMRCPPHTHVSTVTVVLVRKGSVRLDANGTARTLRAGGAALVLPHVPHGIRAAGAYEMVSVCLGAALLRPPARTPGRAVLAALEKAVRRGHLLRSELEKIAGLLASAAPAEPERHDSLSALRETLEANPEEAMSLADMAAIAHAGKTHLIRKFKRRYGLTPRGFQNQNRLRKARRDLMGDRPLTQTALRAGFYDQSHFIRHFKRYHGITPGQYLASRASL